MYLDDLEISSIFLVSEPTSVGAGAGACLCQEGKEGSFSNSLFTAHPTGRLHFPGVLCCDALEIGQIVLERSGNVCEALRCVVINTPAKFHVL